MLEARLCENYNPEQDKQLCIADIFCQSEGRLLLYWRHSEHHPNTNRTRDTCVSLSGERSRYQIECHGLIGAGLEKAFCASAVGR